MLDLVPLGEVPYPTAKESYRHLGGSISDLAGHSLEVVRTGSVEATMLMTRPNSRPMIRPDRSSETSSAHGRHLTEI